MNLLNGSILTSITLLNSKIMNVGSSLITEKNVVNTETKGLKTSDGFILISNDGFRLTVVN